MYLSQLQSWFGTSLKSASHMGNSEQEGTSAKTSFLIKKKAVFLGNITTFSRVNRKVSAYFLVGIQNLEQMHIKSRFS